MEERRNARRDDGPLSVALVASLSASTVVPSADADLMSTLVLGVASTSILLQSVSLTLYIGRSFPEEQLTGAKEMVEMDVRLAKVSSAIYELKKLESENKISEEDLANNLERGKDELGYLLSDIDSSYRPAKILRSRRMNLLPSLRLFEELRRSTTATGVGNDSKKEGNRT